MSPAVASSRPAIRRRAVLLPQPDGPTSTRNSLSWIWIVRSLTARTSPKILLTWSRVTPAIGVSSTRNMSRAAVDNRAPCAVALGQVAGHDPEDVDAVDRQDLRQVVDGDDVFEQDRRHDVLVGLAMVVGDAERAPPAELPTNAVRPVLGADRDGPGLLGGVDVRD